MMTPIRIGPFFVRGDQASVLRRRNSPTAGVYRIINAVNGKCYVGSSKNLARRLDCHASELIRNKHSNKHLQNSFNKHGEGVFAFYIEEVCGQDSLLLSENEAIKAYGTMDMSRGYNMQMGVRDDTLGRWSREVRDKISASNRKTFSERPDSRRKNSERLTAWHKNHPGVAGGPRKVYTYVHKSGERFTGCANELKRAYPDQALNQSGIWRIANGKAKSYRGWSIAT